MVSSIDTGPHVSLFKIRTNIRQISDSYITIGSSMRHLPSTETMYGSIPVHSNDGEGLWVSGCVSNLP